MDESDCYETSAKSQFSFPEETADSAEVTQLRQRLESTERRLAESECSRTSLEEDIDKSRKQYESEISLLKIQVRVYEEDYNAIKRELDATKSELETTKTELSIARSLLASHSQSYNSPTLEELARRREAALASNRQQYEQRQRDGGAYQTDSYYEDRTRGYSSGEDEID